VKGEQLLIREKNSQAFREGIDRGYLVRVTNWACGSYDAKAFSIDVHIDIEGPHGIRTMQK
jgi:hypothetical protein